jgi:imidazolonepropionase-like amidohydrolase/ABC-type multidrug transport system permease subunit
MYFLNSPAGASGIDMTAYLTNIAITLRLMTRDRMTLFFGYVFPLIFFFLFAQMMAAGQGGGVAKQVVTMVLIFGVLGNGFFGAGMRAVSDREQNILRRFKVAPTTAAPLLVSWLVTGWINYIPSALFLIAIGHFAYQMPWPERPFTLFIFLSVAVLAFRALGLIIASVVNSMQESQILIQLCYLPMLFLSGATFPVSAMPEWLRIVAQFMPSSHLFGGLQGILLRKEGLEEQWKSLLALILTLIVGMFLSVKLFRWEKEEKVKSSAKLWVIAALAPFLVLGVYQAYSKESLNQAKVLQRELRRSRTLLIRDVRLFIGDGRVIERGALLVRDGKIAQILEGGSPEAKTLNAEPIEGGGKTLLPGLIDANVQLTWPGGVPDPESYAKPEKLIEHSHTAYLFSGVTTIRSVGDGPAQVVRLRDKVARGERLASEIFFTGPQFTTRDAIAASPLKNVPAAFRDRLAADLFRTPESPGQAIAMAGELQRQGAGALYVDTARLPAAIVAALKSVNLPILATAENPAASALLGTDAPPAEGIWIPSLTAFEALVAPKADLLERSLVQQVAPKGLLERTRPVLAQIPADEARLNARLSNIPAAAAKIVAGSGAGQLFVLHGPGIHRELALLVQAGLTPNQALQSATGRAAASLGAANRIGLLKPGMEADLILVDGNPLRDIAATERISLIVFRGERVSRANLFEQEE